jgi:hypothetical protein
MAAATVLVACGSAQSPAATRAPAVVPATRAPVAAPAQDVAVARPVFIDFYAPW